MSQAEDLLNSLSEEDIVDDELIIPVNEVFLINPETRMINVPDSEKLFGARQDMDVERKYFKCPRIVGDNIDLLTHHIYVSYVPSKQDGTYSEAEEVGSYLCEDLAANGEYVTFSWLLSANVFTKAGYIAFAVYAKQADENGILKTKWHTSIAVGNVLDTLPDGNQIIEKYPDVIEQLLKRIEELQNNGTGPTANGVQYVEQTLTEKQQSQARTNIGAASTTEVSKLSEDKVTAPAVAEVGQILEVEKIDENGKPLTFKAVNKPSSRLPDVTEEDNGKFLQVVAGAWSPVAITDGNEVAY